MAANIAGTIEGWYPWFQVMKGHFTNSVLQPRRGPTKCNLPLLLRVIVAVVFHRRGLWLFYAIKVPARVRRRNRVAIVVVMLAAVCSATLVRPELRVRAVLATWALGHIL